MENILSLAVPAMLAFVVLLLLVVIYALYMLYYQESKIIAANGNLWVKDNSGNNLNSGTPYYRVSKGLYVNGDGTLCLVIMKGDDGKKHGILTGYGVIANATGPVYTGPLLPPSTTAAGSWSGYGQVSCDGYNVCCYPGLETPPPFLGTAARFPSNNLSYTS